MKSTKYFLSAFILFLLMGMSTKAQNDRYQLYVVHEDYVADGMKTQHEKADKALLKAAKDHQMKDMEWITFVSDDNRVMYLSPINSMAELDKDPFEDLSKKMGEGELEKIFESYNGTYKKHGDYILRLDKELSYMPGGISQTQEGKNYRELVFYWISPEKAEKAEQLAKSVKDLYSKKNTPLHYRLYKSGFGTMGDYFMVAISAESPEALEKLREENMKLLGEDGKKIAEQIEEVTSKQEVVTGYLKPELSYVANN